MRPAIRIALVPLVLLLSACELVAGFLGQQGAAMTFDVKASEGLEFEKDGISIRIPPNALGADTTITAAGLDEDEQPESDRIASAVVDFGPDGTTFAIPVELGFTLDDDAFSPLPGSVPVLAFLKDGAWEVLPDSRLEGRTVFATTTHFTPFAVVWTAGSQTQGGCEDLPITPCCGDLLGTWSFSAACAILPSGHEPLSGCPGASATYSVDLVGSVTFNADGTYGVNKTETVLSDLTIPKTCLPSGKTCADLPQLDERLTVTGEDATNCLARRTKSESDTEGGTYTVAGTRFSTLPTGDSTANELDYCVDGTSAVVRDFTSDGVEVRYRVTKM